MDGEGGGWMMTKTHYERDIHLILTSFPSKSNRLSCIFLIDSLTIRESRTQSNKISRCRHFEIWRSSNGWIGNGWIGDEDGKKKMIP